MTRDEYKNITRVGRGELLSLGTANMAEKPVRRGRSPAETERALALRDAGADDDQIDTIERLLGVSDVQRALAVRGITSAEQLIAAIDRSDDLGAHGYMRPPPPRKSLSALYSDVEVLDTVATDTIIVDIPTTAGQVTTSITLAQMPMKWSFGDLTFDGDVASPGSTKKIEIRVILGTRTITKFRLSQLSRTTDSASVLDALQKVYDYEIGPNSTVKIEIENMNPNAIETFTNGFFQYVYHPVIDAEASRIIRGR